jgi:hypothetical protein
MPASHIATAEVRDARVLVGEPLMDRSRLLERVERAGQLAGVRADPTDVEEEVRQPLAELDDRGVVADQLLEDLATPTVRLEGHTRLAAFVLQVAEVQVGDR